MMTLNNSVVTLLAVALASISVEAAEANYFWKTNPSSYAQTWAAWVDNWQDANKGPHTAYSKDNNYFYLSAGRLPKPAKNAVESFPGGSLTISNNVLCACSATTGSLDFDDIRLSNGSIQLANGDKAYSNATSWATAVVTARKLVISNKKGSQCSIKAGTAFASGCDLNVAMEGESGAKFSILSAQNGTILPQTRAARTHVTLRGDLTGYSGLFAVTADAQLYLSDARNASATITANGGLGAAAPNDDAVIKMLTVEPGASLEVCANADGTVGGRIVVMDSFVLDGSGKIGIYSEYTVDDDGVAEIPVLTYPATVGIGEEDFELLAPDAGRVDPTAERNTTRSLILKDETDAQGDDVKTLYVRHVGLGRMNTLEISDSSNVNITDETEATCAWTNGVQWSLKEAPKVGLACLIPSGKNIRTPRPLVATREGIEAEAATFPCPMILEGTMFVRQGTIEFYKGLTLLPGAMIRGNSIPHRMEITSDIMIDAQGGSVSICAPGEAYEQTAADGKKFLTCSALALSGRISGIGQIIAMTQSSTSRQNAEVLIENDNPGFMGTWLIDGLSDYEKDGWVAPALKKYAALGVTTCGALGGPLPVASLEALVINRYGRFIIHNSIDLADTTRGITVKEFGRISVPDPTVTATNHMPVSYCGVLRKDGQGTLVMSCAAPTLGAVNPGTNNTEFLIAEGKVKVGSSKAFNNLTLKLGKDTKLALDLSPADSELKAYGLYNESTTPFISGTFSGGDSDQARNDTFTPDEIQALPLTVDYDEATLPNEFRASLVTVKTAVADAVLARIAASFPKIRQRKLTFTATPVEGSDMTTISVSGIRPGLAIILR